MVPVVMIDMHSYGDFQADQTGRAERPDICVGGDNTHTPAWMIEHTRAVFERHGYTTAYNQPYEGSIIPRGLMGNLEYATIMFEVHKRLYLIDQSRGVVDERGFAKLKLALGEAAAILRDEP
jgi:N-formylglutamate amidohydrolase